MSAVTADAPAPVHVSTLQRLFDRLPVLSIEKDDLDPSFCFFAVPRPPVGSFIIYRCMDDPTMLVLLQSTDNGFNPTWDTTLISYNLYQNKFCHMGKDVSRIELNGMNWGSFQEIINWAGGQPIERDQAQQILTRFHEIQSFSLNDDQTESFSEAPKGTFFTQSHPTISGRFFLFVKDDQGDKKIPISISPDGQIIALLPNRNAFTYRDFSAMERAFNLLRPLFLEDLSHVKRMLA